MRARYTNVTSTSLPRLGPNSGMWREGKESGRLRGEADEGAFLQVADCFGWNTAKPYSSGVTLSSPSHPSPSLLLSPFSLSYQIFIEH